MMVVAVTHQWPKYKHIHANNNKRRRRNAINLNSLLEHQQKPPVQQRVGELLVDVRCRESAFWKLLPTHTRCSSSQIGLCRKHAARGESCRARSLISFRHTIEMATTYRRCCCSCCWNSRVRIANTKVRALVSQLLVAH